MTYFSLRPQGGTVLVFWGLLSFLANAESLPDLTDLQVRKIWCCLSIIIKHTDICLLQNNSSVKEYKCCFNSKSFYEVKSLDRYSF